MHPLVKLAANATPQSRRFILFAGAGVSKDAGQASAWDVMMATAELLRRADEEKSDKSLEEWFLASRYAEESYSTLMEQLFPNTRGQDDFLNEQLHLKQPGEAHELIAELALRGVISAIITTNVDDLLEQALTSRGLAIQVLATEDDFEHAEPLIHASKFRVYKPHGTLGRGQLRNTPADLATLPSIIADELVNVISDHGLIVQGYAGEDESVLGILSRRRRSIYPVFWFSRDVPNKKVGDALGDALVHVPSTSASKSLSELIQLYGELRALAPVRTLAARLLELQTAINEKRPSTTTNVRDFIKDLRVSLQEMAPDLTDADEPDELLLEALNNTVDHVSDFGRLAGLVASSNSEEYVREVYDGFGIILKLTDANLGRLKRYSDLNADFGKFIVYEMFVMFIAKLIHARWWGKIDMILTLDLYEEDEGPRSFLRLNNYNKTLDDIRKQRLNLPRISVFRDTLAARHEAGGVLEKVVSHQKMEDADYFLMLRTAFQYDNRKDALSSGNIWIPWAMVEMSRVPEFLGRCFSKRYAQEVAPALGVGSCEGLKTKLAMFRDLNKRFFSAGFVDSPGDRQPDFVDQLCTRP